MNDDIIKTIVFQLFEEQTLPGIMDYIRIPNGSPNYDPQWDTNGNQEKAVSFMANWVLSQNIKGLSLSIYKEKKRTPFLYIDINSSRVSDKRTILMYGHFDKQPAFTGWSPGLGPTIPVIKDGKLYGRGSTDDGYALFGMITAIKTCQRVNLPLPRIVIIVEGAEESNIEDLNFYLSALKTKIGTPDFIVCLDSGVEDYKRLWVTTSLRGNCAIDLTVKTLKVGMHSGGGTGFVADSYFILRRLLDRVENSDTGEIIVPELRVSLPKNREEEIKRLVTIVKDDFLKNYPFYENTQPIHKELFDLVVNNTWQPTLAVTGADGFPEASTAGNVLRPFSTVRLSFRLPPGVDTQKAGEKIVEILSKDPPYNAVVEAKLLGAGDGWNLDDKNYSKKLKDVLNTASKRYFGNNEIEAFGEGGSIPFVQTFNQAFPKADLAVMGVAGPGSSIHGPDENLDLEFCKRFICCIAHMLSEY